MRELLCMAFLALSCFLANGQNPGVVKFLDIPVDGTKSEMISRIKEKGFGYYSGKDCLYGKYNGKYVDVFIETNHGAVYWVIVKYYTGSEMNVIDEYNELLEQFNRNKKYITPRENVKIPRGEHIAYEMSMNHKRYSATYYYLSPDVFTTEEADRIRAVMDRVRGASRDSIKAHSSDIAISLLPEDWSDEYLMEYNTKWPTLLNGQVWFAIVPDDGEFTITINYQNVNNSPDGEDL